MKKIIFAFVVLLGSGSFGLEVQPQMVLQRVLEVQPQLIVNQVVAIDDMKCPDIDPQVEIVRAQQSVVQKATQWCGLIGQKAHQVSEFESGVGNCITRGGGTFHVHQAIITTSQAYFTCTR